MGVGSTGPEPLYAAMTSGNAGTIRGLGADAGDAMGDVRDCIELIRYAQDRPEWDSDSARRSFNMRAWATRASSEVCFNRLNRVQLAVDMVAGEYVRMDGQAQDLIEWYRTEKQAVVDALGMFLLMFVTVNNLGAVRDRYAESLGKASDFVTTDPFSADSGAWLELGLVKSMLRDIAHGTMPGPVIPETFATGQDDRDWTPQGLGIDPTTGNLIQTSYYQVGDGDDAVTYAHLTIIDPDTGAVISTVELDGYRDGPPPDHAGGVVVHGDTVWVTSSGSQPTMVPYSLSDLSSPSLMDKATPIGPPQEVRAGSASTIHGDTLYVGSFNDKGPGEMFTYTWDPASKSWTGEQGPFEIPTKTQGIAVRGNEIVFSSSFGRDKGSELLSYNLPDVTGPGSLGQPLRTVDLPPMSEGVVILPGGLVTTHESGATPYSTPNATTDPDDMWGGMFMTVTPFDELGMAGGIDVVPVSLESASVWFADAETGLGRAERRVGRLQLPATSLGQVPGASGLTAAVNGHLDETSTWLGESRISSGTTASGLIAAANDYEDAEARSDGLFGFLQRFVS